MFGFFKEKASIVSAGFILAASNAVQVMAQAEPSPASSTDSQLEIIGSVVGVVAMLAITVGVFCCMKHCKLSPATQNPSGYIPIQQDENAESSPVLDI